MKRILLIGQLDGYANSVRPLAIQRFLEERGHEVRLFDTSRLSRASRSPRSIRRKLPALRPDKLALYMTEVASALLTRRWELGRRRLSYHLAMADHRLRRAILKSSLPLDDFDLVIGETPNNAGVLTAVRSARTLYDCPQPWADEAYFQGRFTARQHKRLRRFESRLFERVDHLAFSWETIGKYAVEQYGISGRNLITLNYGCTPSADRVRFDDPPRIVYLGFLGMEGFINLPLLARLSSLYPNIDVYGGPPPDPRLKLNYLGYAPPDVLRNYQIGLITCSKDLPMRQGFSAKQLTYIAYGLPVLVPAWRRNAGLEPGSVYYTEETFRSCIDMLSDEKRWQSVSDEAYAHAHQLSWDNTLRPLETLLDGPSSTEALRPGRP